MEPEHTFNGATTMKPKKPFMIERNSHIIAGAVPGDDFARITFNVGARPAVRWVVFDGSRYATRAEAQFIIDNTRGMEGANVVEVIEEIRYRVRASG